MNPNKVMWSLIFSICLILSLACGGGAGGGAAGGPAGGSSGGQPGGAQGGGAGRAGGGQAAGPQGGGAGSPGGPDGGQTGGGPQGGAGPAAGGEARSGPGASGGNGGPGVAGANQPGAGPGAVGGAQVGGNVSVQGNVDGAAAAETVSEAAAAESASTDYEANEAIEQYARDVLGINVTIVGSGAREGDVNVPISTESDLEATASVAGVTYAATLQTGAASVSLGSGDVSGDLEADIQSASLGSFSLIQAGRTATDENSALDLIKATYPGIADLPYTAQETSSGEGETYTFIAQTQQNEVDVKTGEATVIAVAALVGVTSTEGQAIVYAVVGRGDFATSIQSMTSQ